MRIAVVGSGISGLVAALRLAERHDVLLFEAAPSLGGHTHTVEVDDDGRPCSVDMGFIVYNRATYPRFIELLDELGVATQLSDMGLSVRTADGSVEYASSARQLFAQRRNLARPKFWRMLSGIVRFNRIARSVLDTTGDEPTMGELLERHRLDGPVVDWFIIPMLAAVWSTDPSRVLEYPARTLATFLSNHGLLQIRNQPPWRVVSGGSQTYVRAIAKRLGDRRIHLNSPIENVRRLPGSGVELTTRRGDTVNVDEVIIATHSDQALAMIDRPTDSERAILGAIPYQDNEVVLHTDERLMPQRKRAWASWNCLVEGSDRERSRPVRLTYWMNNLQSLDTTRQYFVSLNSGDAIDPESVIERRVFAHPLFNSTSVAAQRRWEDISGVDRLHFCGAYWGWGFHEDGVRSGLRVVAALDRRVAALEVA
ncbi:MAG: FAD-dependent oxidoreductase [Acidobacteriota bacterium]